MSKASSILLICLPALLPLISGQGCGVDLYPGARDLPSPVYIIDTELLVPPAVWLPNVFKPQSIFPIDAQNPAAGQAVGFYLIVATDKAQDLKVRLIDSAKKTVTNLTMLAAPGSDEQIAADKQLQSLNSSIREQVLSGHGVYWLADTELSASGLEHRFAILIPESLRSPFMHVEVFADIAEDGSPIGSDHIEVVDDFFYMVVFGDSVMWGNGLRTKDKIYRLVADTIEAETNQKVIVQLFAVSAATIVPTEYDDICTLNCIGEVPKAVSSVTTQVDLMDRPDLVDLILLNGCINDVSLTTILNADTTEEQLTELTWQFCADQMQILLEKIRSILPQVPIVVTSYYPIVSEESDLFGLRQWQLSQNMESDENLDAMVESAAANSEIFNDVSRAGLSAAVDAVNQTASGTDMVALADPGYGPQNAVFAPESWLWGLASNGPLAEALGIELLLLPEDPLFELRINACHQPNVIPDLVSCLYASVGHPNPTGARAYAEAIIEQLRKLGVLPELTTANSSAP